MEKSRIKAIISQNKRDEARQTIYMYTLLLLMTAFVYGEFQTILQPNTFIYTAEANQSSDSLVQTSDTAKTISVASPEEVIGVKEQSNTPTVGIIRQVAQEKGFKQVDNLLRLAKCESGFNEKVVHKNGDGTTDYGVMQWNDYYHPEISKECALNASCAVREAIKWINKGHLKEWHCSGIWNDVNYKI